MEIYSRYYQKYKLFDNIPEGVIVINSDFAILFWNRVITNWTGRSKDEMTGKKLNEFYANLNKPYIKSRFNNVLDFGPPLLFSSQLHGSFIESYLPNGEPRVQQTSVVADLSLDDKTLNAVIFIQDVSELTLQINNYIAMRDKAVMELNERKKAEKEKESLIEELYKALDEIKTLRDHIPICSLCKKIRDDKGYWEQLESYISKHTGSQFSHGICPDCMQEHYSDYI